MNPRLLSAVSTIVSGEARRWSPNVSSIKTILILDDGSRPEHCALLVLPNVKLQSVQPNECASAPMCPYVCILSALNILA